MIRTQAEDAGIRKCVYPQPLPRQLHNPAAPASNQPHRPTPIVGHESLTMIPHVYANLTMDHAHNGMMRSLLAERDTH
jgi:hypothetical protein